MVISTPTASPRQECRPTGSAAAQREETQPELGVVVAAFLNESHGEERGVQYYSISTVKGLLCRLSADFLSYFSHAPMCHLLIISNVFIALSILYCWRNLGLLRTFMQMIKHVYFKYLSWLLILTFHVLSDLVLSQCFVGHFRTTLIPKKVCNTLFGITFICILSFRLIERLLFLIKGLFSVCMMF